MGTHKLPYIPWSIVANVTNEYVEYGKIRIKKEDLVGLHLKVVSYSYRSSIFTATDPVALKNFITIVGRKKIKIGIPTPNIFNRFVQDFLTHHADYLVHQIVDKANRDGYAMGPVIVRSDHLSWKNGILRNKYVDVPIEQIMTKPVRGGLEIYDAYKETRWVDLNFWKHINSLLIKDVVTILNKKNEFRK